jgi:hypothetical protein
MMTDHAWRAATTEEVLARRDRILEDVSSHMAGSRLDAAIAALRQLAEVTIDDTTLRLTDPLLKEIAGPRRIIASFDPSRQPGPDEVVIVYGNYPHMFGNVVVNNPIRRHVADFWRFAHDEVEFDARWHGLGRIFVINVDDRRDRHDAVLRELASARAPFHLVTRVSAQPIDTRDPGGPPGQGQSACLRSHIETLRMARAVNADHVLVLEDDFCFTSDLDAHLSDLQAFIARHYDYWICLVATSKYGSIKAKDDLVAMSFQACTNTGGYLVSRAGIDQVLPLFEGALSRMRATGDFVANAVDRCWAVLQASGKFLVFRRKFGFQAASFSDIERSISRYLD